MQININVKDIELITVMAKEAKLEVDIEPSYIRFYGPDGDTAFDLDFDENGMLKGVDFYD